MVSIGDVLSDEEPGLDTPHESERANRAQLNVDLIARCSSNGDANARRSVSSHRRRATRAAKPERNRANAESARWKANAIHAARRDAPKRRSVDRRAGGVETAADREADQRADP